MDGKHRRLVRVEGRAASGKEYFKAVVGKIFELWVNDFGEVKV